ncbi:MAG: sterol desaturase family protein [Pseudomonadota bacterium]
MEPVFEPVGWGMSVVIPTLIGSIAFGFFLLFGLGGIFHRYYFKHRKDQKDEWKIQPRRWPSDERVKTAIKYSSMNLVFGGITGTFLTLWVLNHGWTMLSFNASDFPWYYHPFSFFLTVMLMDLYLYYSHRFLHSELLFESCHMIHHKWLDPHIYTTVAMHPIEFFLFQMGLIIPMFVVPQFWPVFILAVMYTYLIGMIDHSGVRIKMPWWTIHGGSNQFHDDHHKFFHVNFGHHTGIWDKLHGTVRREDREYGANIYGGKGRKSAK